jgi:hypothetical protein
MRGVSESALIETEVTADYADVADNQMQEREAAEKRKMNSWSPSYFPVFLIDFRSA